MLRFAQHYVGVIPRIATQPRERGNKNSNSQSKTDNPKIVASIRITVATEAMASRQQGPTGKKPVGPNMLRVEVAA